MPLPAPNLDDLRFQKDLVDEARRRITRYCPEWTETNLSDPGLTLVELFAWMTEMLVYRLNRVPEKNYIKFMELLGVQLQAAESAEAALTFMLAAPFPINPRDETQTEVPAGHQVATRSSGEEEEIIFTTKERLVIGPPRLTQLRRSKPDPHRNYWGKLGSRFFHAFGEEVPREGDAFYLGFDEEQNLSGYCLKLSFECVEKQGAGIKPDNPAWVWECWQGDRWEEAIVIEDETGGLNEPEGHILLDLPLTVKPGLMPGGHGGRVNWLRCRHHVDREKDQDPYTRSPQIKNIIAHTLGATTLATHAVVVGDEMLGYSSGDPGQAFKLRHVPALALSPDERVEVEEEKDGELVFVPWQLVPDFSTSRRYDRHFTFDPANGQLSFGPAVREPDGNVSQCGRVPEAGRRVRIGQYRHGGGVVGNVPAGKLQVMKSALPYIDRVTNEKAAEKGVDQESLEAAKLRAARELHSQGRAVTAADYENHAREAGNGLVGRARCRAPHCIPEVSPSTDGVWLPPPPPLPPGNLELLIVPKAYQPFAEGGLFRLALADELKDEVEKCINEVRVLTSSVYIRAPRYLGVEVAAAIIPAPGSQPDRVENRVRKALRYFITPWVDRDVDKLEFDVPGPDAGWEGWPFGRRLYLSELYLLIQRVPGVGNVKQVKLYARQVDPNQEAAAKPEQTEAETQARPKPVEETAAGPEAELKPLEGSFLEVPGDVLLCSLEHKISFVEY